MRKVYAGCLGGLAAGILLAACSPETAAPGAVVQPSPLLYEVTSPNGEIEAWLFGTIHALPDGVNWRTAELEDVTAKADFLIAEIADLDNRAAIANTFTLLAENGVDRAMIEGFSDRPVRELEGARKQLGIFDDLAEEDQRQLLVAVMDDIENSENKSSRLREAWLSGDEVALVDATETGMMHDPELREALLVRRNRDWTAQLLALFPEGQEPMIAVGAGHLVGPDGLPAMLEAEGYIVRRIQ